MQSVKIIAKFDEYGNINIPKSIRDELDIKDGTIMEVIKDRDSIIIRKIENADIPNMLIDNLNSIQEAIYDGLVYGEFDENFNELLDLSLKLDGELDKLKANLKNK